MHVGHYRRCSFCEKRMCEVGIALEMEVDHQGIYASERQKGCRGQEDVVAVLEDYRNQSLQTGSRHHPGG